MGERDVGELEDLDREEAGKRQPQRAPLERGQPQAEPLRAETGDPEDDQQEDPLLDQRPDGERPLVERVVLLASARTAGVLHDDEERHQREPEREPRPFVPTMRLDGRAVVHSRRG